MKNNTVADEKRSIVDRWDLYYKRGQVIGGYPVSPTVQRFFVDTITDNGSVLEIGCGSGRSYSHLMDTLSSWDRQWPFYVGADSSRKALQASVRRPGFNPVLCDIFHLPFKSESFQIVYSRNAFTGYSPSSVLAAGSEIGRVLAFGGYAAVEERGEFDRNVRGAEQSLSNKTTAAMTREMAGELFEPLEIVTWSEEVKEREISPDKVTVHSITAVLAKR